MDDIQDGEQDSFCDKSEDDSGEECEGDLETHIYHSVMTFKMSRMDTGTSLRMSKGRVYGRCKERFSKV